MLSPRRILFLLLFVVLILPQAISIGAEETETDNDEKYKFEAFAPVFHPKETLSYNVYWKGLKVGGFDLRTGEKPPEKGKYRYHFNAKSNRFGKWIFRFFSTTANSVQDSTDGSSLDFFRHLSRDKRYLEERLSFEYNLGRIKQHISKVRGSRPVERIRLINEKMIDPLLMIYHLRAEKFEKKGETREYMLFCDDFFKVPMEVLNQKTKDYDTIEARKIWIVKCNMPKTTLSFRTGSFLLEIDVATGIILSMSWDDAGGKCKALLVKTDNSPLKISEGN